MSHFQAERLIAALIVAAVCWSARGDDPYVFDLADLGDVTELDPAARLSVIVSTRVMPAEDDHLADDLRRDLTREEVFITVGGRGSVVLGVFESWKTEQGYGDSDGVHPDSVKLGLLKNRPDLLLVAWSSYWSRPFSGHAAYRGCMIVSLTGDSPPRVMLLSTDLASVSRRHAERVLHRSFGVDPESGELIERVRVSMWREADRPLPLGHWKRDEGNERLSVVGVTAVAERRIQLDRPAWRPRDWKMYYNGKAGDRFSEIAEFFLGPTATTETIRDANPAVSSEGTSLSADTAVWLPIPSSWIEDSLGSVVPGAIVPAEADPVGPASSES